MSAPESPTVLADAAARALLRHELGRTHFVEAGAGCGKTDALVKRVVGHVLVESVPLARIAAVTFTDRAAAELRDRLRQAFEEAHDRGEPGAGDALDDLDGAAIGTLHSFARRLLGQHPIEAGLPPVLQVGDEVASQVRFERRWAALQDDLLTDPGSGPAVLLGLAAGITLQHLRSVALIFNGEWDRLGEVAPPPLPAIDVAPFLAEARSLLALREHCTDESDIFLGHLDALDDWARRLRLAPDAAARLSILGEELKSHRGRKATWVGCDLAAIRARLQDLDSARSQLLDRVQNSVLRIIAARIARGTVEAARRRQREGELEFHDLLVLAREVLRDPRHGAAVREGLSRRYQRLLLDEFQDSDPIQIELAVRVAAGAAGDGPHWHDVAVPPGRLFLVGDPKQSIYRFRRADIATYLEAQERLGEHVPLTTNFRSTPTIVEWVNATFEQLITPEPGSQPAYRRLHPHRADPPGGTRLIALGLAAHPSGTRADDVREAEAAEVAASIRSALSEGWPVQGDAGRRPVTPRDIAVLVPARTSLPQLEQALEDAGVPFRAEASSLVYRTAEVRDLLMAARALDDPADPLALVAALRSPLFGCGDDDLLRWRRAGGSFTLTAPPRPEVLAALPPQNPVPEAIAYLRELHDGRAWLAPSEVLAALVRDRRTLELPGMLGGGVRARDVWRRVRFVIDQARAWSESEHGGLRAYLAWALRQGEESSRVSEAVLPETDIDAVRVLTVHAAKGLEFPVVVLSGLSSKPQKPRGVNVLWQPDGYEIRIGKSIQTGDYEAISPIDEQMGHHERLRLLYVACTRARDHLVVSYHRVQRPAGSSASRTAAELLFEARAGGPAMQEVSAATGFTPALPAAAGVGPVEPFDAWQSRLDRVRRASRRRSAVSASSLERPATAGPGDPGLAKGARDLELPPWTKGRYGTAVGRAVHGTLQSVDLATGAGLDQAVEAQALAEGVLTYRSVVRGLCRAALGSVVVARAATRPHWRESYVGAPLRDPALARTLLTLDGGDPETTHDEALQPASGALLEGFVDLLFRDDDGGLVVVDYKTDVVRAADVPARVAFYRPQLAAYLAALSAATGEPVHRGVLLFLHPGGAHEHEVSNIWPSGGN